VLEDAAAGTAELELLCRVVLLAAANVKDELLDAAAETKVLDVLEEAAASKVGLEPLWLTVLLAAADSEEKVLDAAADVLAADDILLLLRPAWVTRDVSLYISSLSPAPQYSYSSPGHMK
jgi:hypothetical protein